MTDMSKQTEALKLAEDALKRVRTQDMELVQMSMIALAAIREALASEAIEQPAPVAKPRKQEPSLAAAWQQGYDQGVADERTSEANIGVAGFGAKVTPARNNPYSAGQQEPVAWMYQCSADSSGPVLMQNKRDWAESSSGLWTETPLYKSPPAQQQEPVAWMGAHDRTDLYYRKPPQADVVPLYTSPPASKPLTDEEIEEMANDFEEGYVFLYRSFARAIEAAHGIKGDA